MTVISDEPSPRPLRMWHTRKEQTTRLLVRRAESYLLFTQGIWIIVTSFLDKVNPTVSWLSSSSQ
ncbi:hypothetical protein [Kribbella monticola]|uniref:hypothetical protein n=1 Tax=Kribbella monticola TaxID=2185285 RepID=UPI0013009DC8|nr:hypothetical protein [Kribbella monticola]